MYPGFRQTNNNNRSYPNGAGGGNMSMNSMRPGGHGGGMGGFSHKAPVLATDMRCYFQCPDGFKKDYDLRLHIKLRHRNEDEAELRRAYQDAEDEIALVRRTYSVFECSLCPKTYNESGAFYDHIRKKHGMEWTDYRDKYGRCETESAPFECKICGKVLKYVRDSIHGHLKFVHKITWEMYIDRIRKMRRGENPGELPSIDMFECKICNVSVKYMWRKDHLKRAHKITEPEYAELYKDELVKNENVDRNMENGFKEYERGKDSYAPSRSLQGFQPEQPSLGVDTQRQNTDNPYRGPRYSAPYNENQYYENNENEGGGYDANDYDQKPLNGFAMDRKPQPNYFSRPLLGRDNPPINNNTLPKPPKSDIQDTKNKVCSSCNVKFETRRLFIEHCTTVHKMKFKTASGATISSSSTPQQIFNQQQVMPPRYPEDDMIQQRNSYNTNQMHPQGDQMFGAYENSSQVEFQRRNDEFENPRQNYEEDGTMPTRNQSPSQILENKKVPNDDSRDGVTGSESEIDNNEGGMHNVYNDP